jgi:DNA-binding response OmpR family regulator
MRRGRSAAAAPTVWRFGDLLVDPATRSCRRGDTRIELTSKEFSVLEYLASRAGEVVSKTEILHHVWDFAFDGDVNIVEVYISNLRRKIDAPYRRASIATVRGAGYRLAADGG